MKIPESWLREFCNPNVSIHDIAQKLTMSGLEVEECQEFISFDDFIIGEILKIERHQTKDRLRVYHLNIGSLNQIKIVFKDCNLQIGKKVALSLKLDIKKRNDSVHHENLEYASFCFSSDIGFLGDSDEVLTLPDHFIAGKKLSDEFELKDIILDINITANRADCFSIYGVARELSALTKTKLKEQKFNTFKVHKDKIQKAQIAAKDECRRYSGRVIKNIDINIKTPEALKLKLAKYGVRSINLIVDLTNYVMIELGQPTHAYDLDKIRGDIIVRKAKRGEKIQLLTKQVINLDETYLVICDDSGPIGLAGIMGGITTSIDESTKNIFLESAFFNPKTLSGKWRKLAFTTDALHRFERGVDYEGNIKALNHLVGLIVKYCGGHVHDLIDLKTNLPKRKPIELFTSKVTKLLGFNVKQQKIKSVFERLKFDYKYNRIEKKFIVLPPSYRFDINIAEDLVEEIARIDGYDKIPSSLPKMEANFLRVSEKKISNYEIKNKIASFGYNEIISYSFIDTDLENDFNENLNVVKLKNPLSSKMEVMRTSLFGSLIKCLIFNINRQVASIKIFELSRVFFKNQSNDIFQPYKISGIASGDNVLENWHGNKRKLDFFDIKADIENFLSHLEISFVPHKLKALNPKKTSLIKCDGEEIGVFGVLHPRLNQKYGLKDEVVLFELNVDKIKHKHLKKHQNIPKYPFITRDISIIVNEQLSVGEVLDKIKEFKSNLIENISFFDIFKGKGIKKESKALAYRIFFRTYDRTLTDVEVDIELSKLKKYLNDLIRLEFR